MFRSKNECNIIYKCTVRLLEDSDVLECEFQPHHKGKFLVEYVCDQLGIKEKDYFGLRYVDAAKQRHWLDLAKSILKQIKEMDPILFSFRVKFYPADPFRLYGNGRILLYQQLKRDLRHGRLYCSAGEAAALGALIVQEEIGDFDPEIHGSDYVSSLRLALRQTDALEKKVMELHQKREPCQPATAAIEEFMGIARGLETYGIDPHPVKDHRGTQLYLGINHSGINAFVSGRRSQHFRWSEVHKLNYEGKMFIAHLSYTDASREPKKHTIGFKCPSGSACRYVWRCAIEQMLFFTLPNSQNASVVSGGGFFSWGTKFKYTGRTEREILTESINALREQKLTNSSTPSKRKASSVPATPSSPQGDLAQIRKILRNSYVSGYQFQYKNYYNTGYSSLPRSTMSEPLGNCMITTDHLGNVIYNPDGQILTGGGLLEPVTEEAKLRASNIDNINNPDLMSDYYFRDSFEHSSTESGLTNPYLTHHHHHQQQQQQQQQQHHQQHGNKQHLLYPNKQQIQAQLQHSATVNSSINNNHNTNNINNNNNNSNAAVVAAAAAASSIIRQQNDANNAKIVRKFRLLNAFIPSFIFVVVAMICSAIFILETESDMFARIKNLPEMISLKYQYYIPLKEYLNRKFGMKLS